MCECLPGWEDYVNHWAENLSIYEKSSDGGDLSSWHLATEKERKKTCGGLLPMQDNANAKL